MRLTLLFLLLLGTTVPSIAQEKISPAELQEDFTRLREKLVQYNPGLYTFVDQETLTNHWDKLEKELNSPLDELEFSQVVIKAIQPVKERHLSQGFHKKSAWSENLKNKKIKLFPFYVFINTDDEVFLIRNASTDSTINLGAQLISINDKPVQEIKEEMFNNLIADDEVQSWKYFETNARFNRLYYRFIDTTSVFQVNYLNSQGLQNTTEVKGVPQKVFADSVNSQTKRLYEREEALPAIYSKFKDSLSTGILRVNSFNKSKIKEGDSKFKRDINCFFDEVQEKGYENIIIDVRGNTGGRITYLMYLLSFIQENSEGEPIFNRAYYKWLSRTKLKEKEEDSFKVNKNPFRGDVYILTDGGSYSASVMMATFARQMANATIVGEPTGGRYDGTSAGSFRVVKLKNSNLTVRIPQVLFSYYVDEQPRGSLLPDIYVPKKVEDFLSKDTDNQLDTLLDLIQQKQAKE